MAANGRQRGVRGSRVLALCAVAVALWLGVLALRSGDDEGMASRIPPAATPTPPPKADAWKPSTPGSSPSTGTSPRSSTTSRTPTRTPSKLPGRAKADYTPGRGSATGGSRKVSSGGAADVRSVGGRAGLQRSGGGGNNNKKKTNKGSTPNTVDSVSDHFARRNRDKRRADRARAAGRAMGAGLGGGLGAGYGSALGNLLGGALGSQLDARPTETAADTTPEVEEEEPEVADADEEPTPEPEEEETPTPEPDVDDDDAGDDDDATADDDDSTGDDDDSVNDDDDSTGDDDDSVNDDDDSVSDANAGEDDGDINYLNRMYCLDWTVTTVTNPPGLVPLLNLLGAPLASFPLLVEPLAVDSAADEITMIGAAGAFNGGCAQDLNMPTVDFGGDGFGADAVITGRTFLVSTPEFYLDVTTPPLTIYDLELQGTFSEDGSQIIDSQLTGLLRLDESIQDYVCVPSSTWTCTACNFGQDLCETLVVEDAIWNVLAPAFHITPIAAGDDDDSAGDDDDSAGGDDDDTASPDDDDGPLPDDDDSAAN